MYPRCMDKAFEALLLAVERLGNRIQLRMQRTSFGAIVQSPRSIGNEFLPSDQFRHGLFHWQGDWKLAMPKEPFFLVSFSEEPVDLKLLLELQLWEKRPQTVGKSLWKLQRVEDVPTLKDYRNLDERDFLEFGAMDPFTQWFVAYNREGQPKIAKGKARATELEDAYFASYLYAKEPKEFSLLLEALEANFPEKPFYFATTLDRDFSRERGFQARGRFRVYAGNLS